MNTHYCALRKSQSLVAMVWAAWLFGLAIANRLLSQELRHGESEQVIAQLASAIEFRRRSLVGRRLADPFEISLNEKLVGAPRSGSLRDRPNLPSRLVDPFGAFKISPDSLIFEEQQELGKC
ncbi:MAG: hypothetical protein AB4038_01175 [Prochloraceae cyanobacterium]